MAERGSEKAAGFFFFRSQELMLYGAVVELGLPETFPHFQVQKTQNPGAVGNDRERWVSRVRGWGHKIWKQTKN